MTRVLDSVYSACECAVVFLRRHPMLNAALFAGLVLLPAYVVLAKWACELLFPGYPERSVGTVKYSVWGKDGEEFTFVPGTDPPKCGSPGVQLLKVIEAESWDEACRRYHEWQGWEPYKPFPDDPTGPPSQH